MRCPGRYNYHVGKLGTEPGLLTESVYCPSILALLCASCLPLSKFPKHYVCCETKNFHRALRTVPGEWEALGVCCYCLVLDPVFFSTLCCLCLYTGE